MTLMPAILLCGLEVGLRIGGYGYNTGFFMPIEGRDQVCGNPRFGWRFFAPGLARMPLPFALNEQKAPGTYRIFILGSSAAQGFPDPAFSFARILEAMLREAFPKARFEVVNTAMVAINSHTVLPIARDCAERSPDLFIVYEGNNEVVGPYGPGTVFAGFSERLWAIRLQLAMKCSRLVQATQNLVQAVTKAKQTDEWKGMEFFLDRPVAIDDPRLAKVYRHFKNNLQDICETGRDAGANVLLCTVGVNLRDCAPFASKHADGIPASDLKRWNQLTADALKLEMDNRPDDALRLLRNAESIDGKHAALHFRIARCCFSIGRFEDARRHFESSRDFDLLRFRADSSENEIIRQVASTVAGGVKLVDIERIMAEEVPEDHGSIGRALFYEHCHMTFRGNYVIARALFDQIVPMLPHAIQGTTVAPASACSIERCMERLAYTPFGEEKGLESIVGLLERAPFTAALNSAEQIAAAKTRLGELEAMKTPESFAEYARQFNNALSLSPDDPLLHSNFAELLTEGSKHAEASDHLRSALKFHPFDPNLNSELGSAMVQMGKVAEGEAEFRRAMVSPYCDDACQANVRFNLGLMAFKTGRIDDAKMHYEAALKYRPSRSDIRTNLGQICLSQGDSENALKHFRLAMARAPENLTYRINLASALAYFKKDGESEETLKAAARDFPQNAFAVGALVDFLILKNRLNEALLQVEKSVEAAPTSADLRYKLAVVLYRMGRNKEAISQLQQVLRSDPNHKRSGDLLAEIAGRHD